MRHFLLAFILLGCLSALLPGCEPKEDLVQTSGSLSFVQDTVLFDTVFTTVRTVTKRLWVYNRNRGAVKTDISLGEAGASPYALVISGDAGPGASGVTVRGNDSLLVLVRATVGDNGTATAAKQFVVADQLNFLTNGNAQHVKLVAYGQNAYFHRGDVIGTNTTWKTDKPHVIVGGVVVAPGITLRIPRGARIYAHAGAQLQVQGTLLVNDPSEPNAFAPTDTVKPANANLVRFAGDRLEPFYADIPGQWSGIVFTATSRGNRIRYAEIKNATFGVAIYNPESLQPFPEVQLDNTTIRNISGANVSFAAAQNLTIGGTGGGIISLSGQVAATNCLITNCGEYAVLGFGGGTFDFNFCTIANYTPSFRRETESLTFTDKSPLDGVTTKVSPRITIRNSIVWGPREDELLLDDNDAYRNNLTISNSVLRTKAYAGPVLATPGQPGLKDPALGNSTDDPLFVRSPANAGGNYDYTLQATSLALKLKSPVGNVPQRDLRNLPRPALTVGAYEHK